MLQQQLNETEEEAKKLVALSNPSSNAVESTNYGSMTNPPHENPMRNEYNHQNNGNNEYNATTGTVEEDEEYVEDFYVEDEYTDEDEDEDEFEDEHYNDDSYSKPKQNKCFHCCQNATQSPGLIRTILSPFRRVGKIMYDAILLISDVDDVWETPALQHHQQQQHHSHSYYDAQNYSTNNNNGSQIRIIMNRQDDDDEERVVTTRHKLRVIFWFLVLMIGYATERSTFKILVDRTGPFRLAFGSIFIPFLHAIVLLTWMIIKAAIVSYHHRSQKNMSPNSRRILFSTKKQKGFWDELCGDGIGLPILDVGFMGFLDTLPLLVVSITGNHVAPLLTVMLVQFTIPLTTLIAQFAHPEGKFHQCKCFCRFNLRPPGRHNSYNQDEEEDMEDVQDDNLLNDLRYTSLSNDNKRNSQTSLANTSVATIHNNDTHTGSQSWGGLSQTHVVGSSFMFISIILAMIPSINSLSSKPLSAWNTLLYLSSCIFAAISQTYKEEVLLKYKSPIDSNHLNFTLSICSFVSAMVFCPIIYILQGLGTGPEWTMYYPPKDYSVNIHDAYQCLFGGLDHSIQQNRYHEVAHCDYSWLISFLHVLGILSFGLAVDKITNAGAIKIMYHGLSGGIIAALGSMFVYQVFFFSAEEYGFALNVWHVICSIILILGSEIYHRVSLEEPMFETVYPDFSNLYYDDSNEE